MSGRKLKLRDIWGYVSGEGATALIMGGMGNFGMLFYTQIFGMRPELVGIALSVATLWDAITDPLMGHISDNTRSRWGRRRPWIFIGALVSAILLPLLWMPPFTDKVAIIIYFGVISTIYALT